MSNRSHNFLDNSAAPIRCVRCSSAVLVPLVLGELLFSFLRFYLSRRDPDRMPLALTESPVENGMPSQISQGELRREATVERNFSRTSRARIPQVSAFGDRDIRYIPDSVRSFVPFAINLVARIVGESFARFELPMNPSVNRDWWYLRYFYGV